MEEREIQMKTIVTCIFGLLVCYAVAIIGTYAEIM